MQAAGLRLRATARGSGLHRGAEVAQMDKGHVHLSSKPLRFEFSEYEVASCIYYPSEIINSFCASLTVRATTWQMCDA